MLPGVNDLYGFVKLDPDGLIHWAKEIDRLDPELDPRKLAFLIDCFKKNVIEYNQRESMQNIFRGLNEIDEDLGTFKRRSFTW